MTTCNFCQTPIEQHEAGRCLDRLIGEIRGEKGAEHCYHTNSEKVKEGEHICCACDEVVQVPNYEEGCEAQHKNYSTDLNHAIELWEDDWIFSKWGYRFRIYADQFFSLLLSDGETLALAICRAYLKEMKEGK